MKRIIASLALTAALGAGLTAGAQAQTFGPTTVTGNANIYSLSVLTNAAATAGGYTYSYEATLVSNPSNTNVTQFTINNILGTTQATAAAGVQDAVPPLGRTATDFGSITPLVTTSSTGTTSIAFAAPTHGFQVAGTAPTSFSSTPVLLPGQGDTAVFHYFSTLPPQGTVSLGTNGQNGTGNLAGTGQAVGPGTQPTIPETSSFALLGLGLLPLGLLARRRMARNN